MQYFKHSELVDNYRVSLKTVHNWIASAKQGKLELKLHEHNGRTYISNSPSNLAVLKKLSEKGKKYRNTLHHKVITPKSEFYDLYSPRQILDIIYNLNTHREIPRQYNYFDGGASNWDAWVNRLYKEKTPNTLKGSIEQIHNNLGTIDFLLDGHKRVNVIDVGVGNAMPAKELLEHLLERGVLGRYIAIDISEEMLRIAERNIKKWFGDKVQFEGYIRDINHERFDDLLVNERLSQAISLVLLLGATPVNFRFPLDVVKTMYGSMSDNDLLVYTFKPDTPDSRQYFDFNTQPGSPGLSPNHSLTLDLLNIDDSLYDVEMGYDEKKRMRYIRIRLKVALTINFSFEDSERNVTLEKGDAILLLRVWHQTPLEVISSFDEAGFKLLQASMTKDRRHLLTISGVDPKQELEA